MGNKMKMWRQWPSCNHPKTHSCRFNSDEIYKTVNSVFFSPSVETPESWFTNSASESASLSTADSDEDNHHSLETLVAGARSEQRLFFDPHGDSNSILSSSARKSHSGGALRESVAVAVDSGDPYGDFRRSMAEMVEANGVKDWEGLEELLGWYLKVNAKDSHAFVVGAFVDLLLDLAGDYFPVAEKEESFSTAVSRLSSPSEHGLSEIVSYCEGMDLSLTR